MERYTRSNSLCNFFDEDPRTAQSPPRHPFRSLPQIYDHHHDNLLFSPARSSTNSTNLYSLLPPPSPESPWILSPHQTPSPSLLYHCIASLHREDGTIFSIASAKGLVFTGSESRRVRAWRQPDCTERGYFKSRYGEVRAILAHGNTLFTAHKDCKVRVISVTGTPENFQAKKITTLPKNRAIFMFPRKNYTPKHKDCISCMAYNHAEGLLYTGSWDRTVKVWRVSDNRCVDSFTAHEDRINGIALNQDDGCVFTCSSDGSVKIWRRVYGQSSHTLTMTLRFQHSPVNALALSSTSSSCFLYSGSSDGFINFWEKEKMSGRFNHGGFLQGHRFAVLCLVAIEKLIFSGSEDTTIRVWRREEGSCFHECLAVLDAHRGPVKCLAASLEIEKVVVMGFLVYSAGLDQTFKVWRIKILPEETGDVEGIDTGMKITEYEMSPVLSPSWVEKKLQGDSSPFH
ncbi:WD40 repeat-containing protein [Handroanthus impetiginosus]|uniref:WD40 repeat-containing protein n=1 Tax=Handroanthus impetiginosus TaxID=429701 RepID=A0A2G9HZU2_9LAMI|nr:WD40 repeat-containing protein [Handroanthus impetiginosus]